MIAKILASNKMDNNPHVMAEQETDNRAEKTIKMKMKMKMKMRMIRRMIRMLKKRSRKLLKRSWQTLISMRPNTIKLQAAQMECAKTLMKLGSRLRISRSLMMGS